MSRAPSNLLQWLRLREIRPVGHDGLPLNLMRHISYNLTRRYNQRIYVWMKLVLSDISQGIHFGKNYTSTWFETVLAQLQELSLVIDGLRINLNYALENGFLPVFHYLVELTPFVLLHSPRAVWLWMNVIVFLGHLAFLTYSFARDEYQVEFKTNIRLLLCSPRSLMASWNILLILESFPIASKERLFEDLCLRGTIHQQSKTFYNLFEKFKEIVHFNLLAREIDSSCHFIIKMDGVIEKIVHEGYCTAICLESLLRQPVSTEVVHKLHFAGLKLQELLSLICELLCPHLRCRCPDCKRIGQRVVCAGIRRLIYVLVTILASIPENSLHYIEAFVEDLAVLLSYFVSFNRYTHGFFQWYTMYDTYDLDRMIRCCSEKWNSMSKAIPYRNELLIVRRMLWRMSPAEYVLHPTFHNVPFKLNREIPTREPILTIRKLQRSNKIRFSPSLTSCFNAVNRNIYSGWPDREYWFGITEDSDSDNSDAE